ncbi:putative sulfate/molybdate transporter [Syntrophobacter fumaroxidans]|uniref:Sulphate transporter n=1 Tax=Syntrophobacter fumaroxidans (strain DSM 10017 / MPOB) TaxID=335543 RepID=A0LEX0_SYNFM|nr:putative sulfate/molybdate transporter [Syntrophobacter fumaroxidans]ABK15972.1 sulphate transporter [Syntrophobacter fumaroxidans MPOB]
MSADDRVEGLESGGTVNAETAAAPRTKNSYNKMEWAGAFGDVGTLIPFVVAYITIVKVDPLGLLFMFGICLLVAGFYYKTPIPIQPMKAIGAAAIAGGISPAALFGSGLTTGIFWFLAGATGAIRPIARLATKPVVRGIMLGLGLSFMVDGVNRMKTAPVLAGIALVVTYFLLTNPKIPAMFMLLIIGIVSAVIMNPEFLSQLAGIHVGFRLPVFSLDMINWNDIVTGTLLFTIPQIPLTLGNAVIAITAENNELFPDRKVTEKKIAVSQGIMNLVSPFFGGVPMCHGAGGMAGHVRFGARTGGALVILGSIVIVLALFFSESVALIFKIFPNAILGVILFFAGSELAIVVRDIGDKKSDFYVMLIVAAFAMWNMGVAFLVGIILDVSLRRGWIKV